MSSVRRFSMGITKVERKRRSDTSNLHYWRSVLLPAGLMGNGSEERWGRPITDVQGVHVWGFWIALLALGIIVVGLLLLSLINREVAILILVALGLLGAHIDMPFISSLFSIYPDFQVFENGVVLYFRFREPRFHPWTDFKGYEWEGPDSPWERGNIVLVPRRDIRRPRPPYLNLGEDLQDPEPVWDHIRSKLPSLD